MSRFLSSRLSSLVPYTPGEQPKDTRYIKLNTNESPFPPSPKAVAYAQEAAKHLQLYSDPESRALTEAVAAKWGVEREEVLLTNGSDEILNFAFMAFCDETHPAVFPDITYGFYSVFAQINSVPYEEIPLRDDFTIDSAAYMGIGKPIFIANPNAPTGLLLPLSEIEAIVKSNPNSVVVIDEAYIDFGGESAVGLIHKYDNLLVTQTFSKSRSMAGGRLGMGIGNRRLIADLNAIKYSTNPYNVNRMTMAAGLGVLEDEAYTRANLEVIIKTRKYTADALLKMGFTLTDSFANFLFAAHPSFPGDTLYKKLRERGILIRHFQNPRILDYNRITIGTKEEMDTLLDTIRDLLEG